MILNPIHHTQKIKGMVRSDYSWLHLPHLWNIIKCSCWWQCCVNQDTWHQEVVKYHPACPSTSAWMPRLHYWCHNRHRRGLESNINVVILIVLCGSNVARLNKDSNVPLMSGKALYSLSLVRSPLSHVGNINCPWVRLGAVRKFRYLPL